MLVFLDFFMALLVIHWVADFVCQTHWQAFNKSKNIGALLSHVALYTLILSGGSALYMMGTDMTWPGYVQDWEKFTAANFILHFMTDFCTSRWSSVLFKKQMKMIWTDEMRTIRWDDFNPHNFFVVIGFDQLLHQVGFWITVRVFLVP